MRFLRGDVILGITFHEAAPPSPPPPLSPNPPGLFYTTDSNSKAEDSGTPKPDLHRDINRPSPREASRSIHTPLFISLPTSAYLFRTVQRFLVCLPPPPLPLRHASRSHLKNPITNITKRPHGPSQKNARPPAPPLHSRRAPSASATDLVYFMPLPPTLGDILVVTPCYDTEQHPPALPTFACQELGSGGADENGSGVSLTYPKRLSNAVEYICTAKRRTILPGC